MPARDPAPPYRGEGPHRLWHVSEDPAIEVFHPHVPRTNPTATAAVWAVDTRHLPTFWFPRDCPRGCTWRSSSADPTDVERLFGDTDADRIHVTEWSWIDRIRSTTLSLYELPEGSFAPDEVGGYWTSRETVEPLDRVEMTDLIGAHAAAGIDLRFTTSVWPWWRQVVASSLDFSGSRLRNADAQG